MVSGVPREVPRLKPEGPHAQRVLAEGLPLGREGYFKKMVYPLTNIFFYKSCSGMIIEP